MRFLHKMFNLNDPGWGRGSDGQKNGQEPPRRPNSGGQGGPPDLDQVWRDFNKRLNNLFGGRRGGGRPNPPNSGGNNFGGGVSPKQTKVGFGIVAAAALLFWLASGFFIVQEGQVGVITQFGKYKSTAQAGFQWRLPYPFQQDERVNISQLRTFEIGFRGNARSKVAPEALMLTEDENIVDVQFVVQYRVKADGAPDYLFKTRDPDESVQQAAQTAMREIVGGRKMDFILYEGRTLVASEVEKLMQQILDRYQTGILVSSVAIQNVQPPEQVQAAFDDAIKAGQDQERQINEGQAYANQVVPLARGQASRMAEQAEGYRAKVIGDATGDTSRFTSVLKVYKQSPVVLRERMYLETMQQMYTQASKIFVDTSSSNNMLYLPIDKIMQQASQGQNGNSSSMSGTGSSPSADLSIPSTINKANNARNTSPLRPTLQQNNGSNVLSRDRMTR
ncbi:MAG: FtsH protease activity modulator HflK [Burkholderiaceae bacterium]|jgi:modulator of FtsH protease HflK|nr:FtsH protease activity modulator HflK [Burkholderiaceae bacterium]